MQDLLIKFLLVDNQSIIRQDESQKSLVFEKAAEATQLLDLLEQQELSFKYCRLCEEFVTEPDSHQVSKPHKQKREEHGIKMIEDLSFSLLVFSSQPGDISAELKREKEKALKRKVKRIKAQI